jgi:hypothetical protein
MTLADGSTLSIIGVGAIRFRIWDDMIHTVTDVRYVLGVRRSHSVSWIHGGMSYGFAVGPWRYFVVIWLSFGVLGAVVFMR